jgi:hypothetical protein
MKGFKNGSKSNSLRPTPPAKPEDVKAELFRLKDEITRLVEKDPAKAASLLTQWLNANSKSSNIPRKKAS